MTEALAPFTEPVERHPQPFTPWASFFDSWEWRQGEHVTVLGPTGTGKTTLIRAAMRKRYDAGGAVAVLATKSRDTGLESWARHDDLTIVQEWPPRPPRRFRPPPDVETPHGPVPWNRRVMVWPRPLDRPLAELDEITADVHRRALTDMFWSGDWCIAAEELWELHRIGLRSELEQCWTQGRSAGISLIGASQRPVQISLMAYSQPSHLFVFGDNDERNLDRLRGIGGMSGQEISRSVRALRGHDVLYIGTRTRELVRTRVPVRKG